MLTQEQRKKALKAIWVKTHKDFKGIIDGVKTIMVFRNGSVLVTLDDLTDAEIMDRLPKGFTL
jgi:hypothetical protein